jgi:serine/threonine-protein kinase RsbW
MNANSLPRCSFDGERLILRLDVCIPGNVEAIEPVVEQILKSMQQMSCAPGRELAVETALREALANAIVHGCKDDPGKQVQCCVACDESRGMLIVVRDPGAGFDPRTIPSPIQGECLFSDHGRGVYLINQLMDEVRYERGGTEIHMRVR